MMSIDAASCGIVKDFASASGVPEMMTVQLQGALMVASMFRVGTTPPLQLAGLFQASVGPGPPTINDSESRVTLIAVAAVACVGLVSLPSCDVTETFSVSHPVKHLVGV